VAGGRSGRIPEVAFGPDPSRTAYEHSKWLAERLLIARARALPDVPLLVARIGGLVGSSATGRTAKRNSLYALVDSSDELPGRILPLVRGARVDMLPRDRAARMLLEAVEAVAARAPAEPQLAHVCAGDSAPTIAAIVEALRWTDWPGRVAPPRPVPVPGSWVRWAGEQLDRVHPLSARRRNTVMGLRYLGQDRVFERDRLRALVHEPLADTSAEELVRLAFELPAPASDSWTGGGGSLARFAA
jgi:nucleoside-diphosphate-sugar epimerase